MEYRRQDYDVIVRLDKGEEVIASIMKLMDELEIKSGSFNGLGASDDVVLGIYIPADKQYYREEYKQDVEIASLFGTLSRMDGKAYIHSHAAIGDPVHGIIAGGHLEKAVISCTCEIHLKILDFNLGRKFSEEIGLNLMTFED